jgi:hypothetical protein
MVVKELQPCMLSRQTLVGWIFLFPHSPSFIKVAAFKFICISSKSVLFDKVQFPRLIIVKIAKYKYVVRFMKLEKINLVILSNLTEFVKYKTMA